MRNTLSYIAGILLVVLGMLTHSEAAIYTSDTTVTFAWTAPAGTPPASYNVFTSSDGVNFSQVGSTNNTSYNLNVIVGNTYYTAVQAVSPTGLAGPMSDASEAVVVVSSNNTLHATWRHSDSSVQSFMMLKNTTGATIEVTPTFIWQGGSHTSPTISLPAHESKVIDIAQYSANLGQPFGGTELTHSGTPGSLIADIAQKNTTYGLSYVFPFKEATATTTTLHATWRHSDSNVQTFLMLKNTTGNAITVTPTFIWQGGSYTSPTISLPAHESKAIDIAQYSAYLGRPNGGTELTHSGAPGSLVADIAQRNATYGLSYVFPFREATGTTTTLHATWRHSEGNVQSILLLKNTTESPITVTPTFTWQGGSYTSPTISLPAHESKVIDIAQYSAYLGRPNGGTELTHSGAPGSLVADIAQRNATYGLSYVFPFREATGTTTTLHATWRHSEGDVQSILLLKNTTGSPITVTPTFTWQGGSYTSPTISLPAHESKAIDIAQYSAYLGRPNGGTELTHSGAPGSLVADIAQRNATYGLSYVFSFNE